MSGAMAWLAYMGLCMAIIGGAELIGTHTKPAAQREDPPAFLTEDRPREKRRAA